MFLSQCVLQNLLCSKCKKYLSVAPVKVYSNREVKCGRCCEENDDGTPSFLYKTVVKDLIFPCINHMVGCNVKLPINKMSEHEKQCQSKKYYCPFCLTFEDAAYNFVLHIKNKHNNFILEDRYFCINLDETFEKSFVYINDTVLLLLTTSYNPHQPRKLFVGMKIARLKDGEDLAQKFMFWSIQNTLLYCSEIERCFEMNSLEQNMLEVDVNTLRTSFQSSVVICKFQEIISTNSLPKLIGTHKKPMESFILCCYFKNISKLDYDVGYYAKEKCNLMNMTLSAFLYLSKRSKLGSDLLGIFIERRSKPVTTHCYLTMQVRLIHNETSDCDKILACERKKFDKSLGWYNLIEYDKVLNSKEGYIKNDAIQVKVFICVEPALTSREPKKCAECQTVCLTCAKNVNWLEYSL